MVEYRLVLIEGRVVGGGVMSFDVVTRWCPLSSVIPRAVPQRHNWTPRRKQEKAKTLDVIRKEAEADQARAGGGDRG